MSDLDIEPIPSVLQFQSRVPPDRPDIFKRGMDLKYKDPISHEWFLMEITDVIVNPQTCYAAITAKFKERLRQEDV